MEITHTWQQEFSWSGLNVCIATAYLE